MRVLYKVLGRGLEPPWISPLAPKASASANFATPALYTGQVYQFLPRTKIKDFWYRGRHSPDVVRHNFLQKICPTPTRAVALRRGQSAPHFVRPVGFEPTTFSLRGSSSTS